jgi:hypothetical protein
VTRLLAWALAVATPLLVAAGIVLELVGKQRDVHVHYSWWSQLAFVGLGGGFAVLSAGVGLLVALSEPHNAIGWIFLAGAFLLAGNVACIGYSDLVVFGGESWPGSAWTAGYSDWSFIPAVFIGPALVAQLFPDGRPLGGRWRWVFWITVAVGAQATLWSVLHAGALDSYPERSNPLGAPGTLGRLADWIDDNGSVAAIPLFAASVAALVVRFRRSRSLERQQMKVIAFAGAVPLVTFALSFAWSALVGENWVLDTLFITGFASLMLIPVGVGIAIMRYRLYDIDRVISRTLVYASLTVVLGAAYAGLVLAGQALFSSFAGGSNLAIAGSTLVVAALFLPLRSRLQQLVDRRFYRRRYDAQQTLEAFGSRLRRQVELAGLCSDLRAVVDETVQPAQVSVWLREERGA